MIKYLDFYRLKITVNENFVKTDHSNPQEGGGLLPRSFYIPARTAYFWRVLDYVL